MSRRALILDGLWYSLCPSFAHYATSRSALLLRPGKQSPRPRSPQSHRITEVPLRRCYSSVTASKTEESNRLASDMEKCSSKDTSAPDAEPRSSSSGHLENLGNDSTAEDENGEESQISHRFKTRGVYRDLQYKTVFELEGLLQMNKSFKIRATTQLLRALIRDRRTKPTVRHYKALILANIDTVRGSPDAVRHLLEEMEENDITADSATLHAALLVLAVHPDYLLRQEILRKLRGRWLTLSRAGWHFVVAGLVREHQFELALEQVSLMERKDIPIENWLHSMIIYNLCDFQEFDEVYRLMRARVDQGHDMTLALWMHVLDTASKARHHLMTRYVWLRRVELDYLHPSVDICRAVLELAAAVKDVELANSVFRFFTKNNIATFSRDYECLIKATVGAGDLPAAFDILCTVHEAGITATERLPEPILAHMIENKTDHREAWQMLKQLKNAKRSIPLEAVQVIVELCAHNAQNGSSIVDDAIGFYKEIYTLCPEGANVPIYNWLLQTCRRAGNREAGLFLVKEMASFGVIPSPQTFEILILMCLDAGNYKSAYMYFQDLLKRGDGVSPEAQYEIRQLCRKSVDDFALRLQYHPSIQQIQPQPEMKTKEERKAEFEKNPPGYGRTNVVYEARIAYNKDRRRRKREKQAMERYISEHGWPVEEGVEEEAEVRE